MVACRGKHRRWPALPATPQAARPARSEGPGGLECLRRELSAALEEERGLRQREIEELRGQLLRAAAAAKERAPAGPPSPMQALAAALEAKPTGESCSGERLVELQERMCRESAFLARQLELQRANLEEALAASSRALAEKQATLQSALEREGTARRGEAQELRALLDAAWQTFGAASTKAEADAAAQLLHREFPDSSAKAFMGNGGHHEEHEHQDVVTLYEMVREALAENLNHQRQLDLEVQRRKEGELDVDKQLDVVELRLNVLQSIIRSVCLGYQQRAGGGAGPVELPSLEQLAEEDARWARLLEDKAGMFHPTDIIDSSYRNFLNDVLELMEGCDCSFKEAVAALPGRQMGLDAKSFEFSPIKSPPAVEREEAARPLPAKVEWPGVSVCLSE